MLHKIMAGAAFGVALTFAGAASAQVVALATDKAGTTFNTMGTAVASVVSENSSLKVIVRPYAGPAAWVPVLNTGEVGLGVMSANSAYQSFTGNNETKTAHKNFRIVMAGEGSLMLGFLVRKDSPIKSYADLKGKRISSEFGGHLSIGNSLAASLAIAGYGWGDVTPVPVVGANDGIEALVADRLDATWASLGQPAAREADTQIGVRYLGAPKTAEAEAIYQKMVFPGARISVAKDGTVPGLIGDTPLLSYDAYVVVNKDVSDEVVTKLVTALWENNEKLWAAHRSMTGFTHDAAVTSAPVAPYHPAAVAFYKAQGKWDDAAEARQQKLLSEAGM